MSLRVACNLPAYLLGPQLPLAALATLSQLLDEEEKAHSWLKLADRGNGCPL